MALSLEWWDGTSAELQHMKKGVRKAVEGVGLKKSWGLQRCSCVTKGGKKIVVKTR